MKNTRLFLFLLICTAANIPVYSQTVAGNKVTYDYLKSKRIYRLMYSNISYQLVFTTKDSFDLYFHPGCIGAGEKIDSGKFVLKANTVLLTNKTGKTYSFTYKELPAATALVNESVSNNPINNKTRQLPIESDAVFISKNPLSALLYFELR